MSSPEDATSAPDREPVRFDLEPIRPAPDHEPIRFARTPEPPYLAVIFASLRRADDGVAYSRMAERMVELAAHQPGFLGSDSARGDDGFGITVSYWASEEDIARWKAHAEHVVAQELGQSTWYQHYELRVARVERAYAGPRR